MKNVPKWIHTDEWGDVQIVAATRLPSFSEQIVSGVKRIDAPLGKNGISFPLQLGNTGWDSLEVWVFYTPTSYSGEEWDVYHAVYAKLYDAVTSS